MARLFLSIVFSIFIVCGSAADDQIMGDAVGSLAREAEQHDQNNLAVAAAGLGFLAPHNIEAAPVSIDDDEWWNDPAVIADLDALDPSAAPAPIHLAAPLPVVGGIAGAFVPPPVVVDPLANTRANAHATAFPFACIGRSFLCNIQKSWLRNWQRVFAHRYEFTVEQRSYPLRYIIPSFGWEEIERIGHLEEDCQMCGKKSIHFVVRVHNDAAPPVFRDLRVGIDCAVFMQYSQAIVWQTAFDRRAPVP